MTRQLKSDLLRLQQVFTKNHDQFRVLNASVDELTCRFILKNKTFFDIQANITYSYPSNTPLWFVISGDDAIIDSLEKPLEAFNNTGGRDNQIINQVILLVQLLCRIHNETLPEELDRLRNSNSIERRDEDTGNESDEVSDENADEEDEEFESYVECDDDDEVFKMDASVTSSTTSTASNSTSEMDAENARILRKHQNLQYGKQSVGNSSKVLLKELDTILRSQTYKNKTYSVQLIDDALDDWNVKLMSVCPDSLLYVDLHRLTEQGLSGSIHMRITFEVTFPFSPPFIQITYPAINGGHVLDQGALCMEFLTKQGWSSAYSIENMLMQISSTLITGHARVDFERTKVGNYQPSETESRDRPYTGLTGQNPYF